ncbi:protein maelstrom homolog [Battus philenor]|uniref:protein maelstrom homolog n=1 Tax=Battus philenor TaxID=42288 RepID=UPI0035D0A529
MPKKPPKNAFYFYMLDFKQQEKEKGIEYENLAKVAIAADPSWKQASPAVRAKFEEMARKAKQKLGVPEKKYTSTGISFAEIEQREMEIQNAQQAEIEDIKNMVALSCIQGNILTEDFYVMDVNYYCKTSTQYVIGESTVLRFNIKDGIKDNYHEIINPGSIPLGYAYDVKQGCMELGLDMPDENVPRSNYMQILANIIDYLKQKNTNSNVLPPIFTMPNMVLPVKDFFLQMCNRAAEDETLFRIYRLDTLFYNLINIIKTRGNEGFPKESLALSQLKKDLFKYTPGLGCEHHEEADKSINCTLAKVKRMTFTILDSCCPIAGIDLVPGQHLPLDFDMDGIITIKEKKKGRIPPSIASFAEPPPCNSSMINDSDSSLKSGISEVKREKRVHQPLRLPKTDYSQIIRPAPELTESNFPTLSAGRGRGRGSLSSSFNKLRFDKG